MPPWRAQCRGGCRICEIRHAPLIMALLTVLYGHMRIVLHIILWELRKVRNRFFVQGRANGHYYPLEVSSAGHIPVPGMFSRRSSAGPQPFGLLFEAGRAVRRRAGGSLHRRQAAPGIPFRNSGTRPKLAAFSLPRVHLCEACINRALGQ